MTMKLNANGYPIEKELMNNIFDILANNTNFITSKEFCKKWDFEIDYTNNIITFWEEEENELDEDERTYYTLTIN